MEVFGSEDEDGTMVMGAWGCDSGDGRMGMGAWGWEPFFCNFEILLIIYLFHFFLLTEKSKWSWRPAGEVC